MNEVLAEFGIYNQYVSSIHVCKLPIEHESSRVRRVEKPENHIKLLLNQGFIWYQDFITFDMLLDYRSYWIKTSVAETLEIDSVIANTGCSASAIVLPFQISDRERVCVFGDDDTTANFSFTLPAGHYQLLFQNREFTPDEVEAESNFDCDDYSDWDEEIELCLLSFIPVTEPTEPKIITYKSRLRTEKVSYPLTLFDRKLYRSDDS